MPSNVTNRRLRLLLLTVLFEGCLGAGAVIWISARGLFAPSPLSLELAWYAVGMSLPLLILNASLYFYSIRQNPSSRYAEFFYEVIVPICTDQTFISAACIGIISGAAEELFFRGAMQAECMQHVSFPIAVIATNVIFACGHFIGSIRRFTRLVFFYFLFGVYFSFLYEFSGSLWVPAITHAVYNTIVIVGVGRLFRSPPGTTVLATLVDSDTRRYHKRK